MPEISFIFLNTKVYFLKCFLNDLDSWFIVFWQSKWCVSRKKYPLYFGNRIGTPIADDFGMHEICSKFLECFFSSVDQMSLVLLSKVFLNAKRAMAKAGGGVVGCFKHLRMATWMLKQSFQHLGAVEDCSKCFPFRCVFLRSMFLK